MSRALPRRAAGVLGALAFLLAIVPARAQAAAPCEDWSFTAPGASQYHKVTIPNRGPTGADTMTGTVMRPKHAGKHKLPGVVVLHGLGGNQCSLWWAARLLASKRFETLVLSYPASGDPTTLADDDVTTIKGVLSWLRSTKNPYVKNLNKGRLGIVGHSLGAIVAANLQQDASIGYLKTIVAYDNLRKYIQNDVSGGVACDKTMLAGPITPRVPALSLGSESACPNHPSDASKRTGYDVWRAAGISVMEAVIAGITHQQFNGGTETTDDDHGNLLKHVGFYTVTWLTRWLQVTTSAQRAALERRLVSQMPLGIPVTDMLFDPADLPPESPPIDPAGWVSAAFLPSKECTDLRACP